MDKPKIALVGVGGISQIVRIPLLKKMVNVELVALCDVDESKVSFVAQKFKVPNVYFDIQNLLNKEKLDGILICTPNNLHYPMALASLERGITTLIEKPLGLNANQARRMVDIANQKNAKLICGMYYRFREDAKILKDFLDKNEIGKPFYIKSGWLRDWARGDQHNWMSDKKISGGGVIMDLGLPLIDLALWLLNKPKINNIRSYFYNIISKSEVEDSALVVIQTEDNTAITIETAWRMHLERDMSYTHVYGRSGGAFMNPLRINKELYGSLVNVTPVQMAKKTDIFKTAFANELENFVNVILGKEDPVTPGEDGIYLMEIIDAVYESAKLGTQVDL